MPKTKSATVYLSLGSNLGNRKRNLLQALARLSESGVHITKVSSIYETDPVGYTQQRKFLNLVAKGRTTLEPKILLRACKRIEKEMGRVKTIRFGPRLIDIDLLMYEEMVLTSRNLTLPHPRMTQRNFVLVPFAEISPRVKHPASGETIKTLLRHTADTSKVKKISPPPINSTPPRLKKMWFCRNFVGKNILQILALLTYNFFVSINIHPLPK